MPTADEILEVGLRQNFTREAVRKALSVLDDYDTERLAWMCRWLDARHEFQVVPEGQWSNWVILAGRGSGKTRLGSEWTGMAAAMAPPNGPGKPDRSLVVAPTKGDLRDVCFEGDSGLVSVIPPSLIRRYNKTPAPRIELMNGNVIGGIAAEAFQRTRGPQWNRAWCIAANSSIAQADGTFKRIDEMRAGDVVVTRDGPRVVEWAGMTNPAADMVEVLTECGKYIHGTMEHPVWTQEDGFICLSDLTPRHHVMCLPTASAGSNAQTGTITGESVSARDATTRSAHITCTSRCTSARLGRSLLDILSTIATKIRAIMCQPTLNLCRAQITTAPIPSAGSQPKNKSAQFESAPSGNGLQQLMWNASAWSAAPHSNQDPRVSLGSTAASGVWSGAEIVKIRHVRALPGRHAVYNLKVRGQPEFFANGILVHNCDEVAAWGEGGKADPEEVWDTMVMSVRLGKDTRILVTTTPKNRPLVKRLVADDDSVLTSASTHVNADNLSPEFARRILKYDGTKVGRQEIYAELIDSEEGGILSRSWIKHWPADRPLPEFHFIVMSIDPSLSEKDHDKKTQTTDPSACSVWGCFKLKSGKPGVMLLDSWAEHLGFPDLLDRIIKESDPGRVRYGSNLSQRPIILPGNIPKAFRKQMAPKVGGRPIDMIVIEGKACGKSLRQTLARHQISTVEFNPGDADKLSRGHFISPIWKDGIIWIPDSPTPGKDGRAKFMSWAEPLIEQSCSYSGEGSVVHDDLYDTMTQGLRVIDWYWLHHLEQKAKQSKGGTGISDDRPLDQRITSNPYAT